MPALLELQRAFAGGLHGAEGVVLVAGRAGGRHHALQIADANVRLAEVAAKRRKRVFAALYHGARFIVQHDVPGKHQRDRPGLRQRRGRA